MMEPTTDHIVGKLCYHQHRCESYERDQEPGRGIIDEIAFTVTLVKELGRRLSDEDFAWYRDKVFRHIGLHRDGA